MRLHHAAGGSRDAQITVFCVVAQSFGKIGVAMMADSEFLLRPRLPARRWLSGSFRLNSGSFSLSNCAGSRLG
jgi:hypothetical protein